MMLVIQGYIGMSVVVTASRAQTTLAVVPETNLIRAEGSFGKGEILKCFSRIEMYNNVAEHLLVFISRS